MRSLAPAIGWLADSAPRCWTISAVDVFPSRSRGRTGDGGKRGGKRIKELKYPSEFGCSNRYEATSNSCRGRHVPCRLPGQSP